MDEDTYYMKPLFGVRPASTAKAGTSNDASLRVTPHHNPISATCPAEPSHEAPPLHMPSTKTICALCQRHVLCYQRPIENAWYCAACGHKENVFAMTFDATEGYDVLAETHCFVCEIAYPSYRQLLYHCNGKAHKKTLANWLRRGSMKNASWNSCPAVAEVKHQLMHVLQTTEVRFRRHITKEAIARLPLLQLPPSWEAFERRLFAQADARHAMRVHHRAALDAVMDCGDGATCPQTDGILAGAPAATLIAPTTDPVPYHVVHVSPSMARKDFETLLHQLRTERTFGFDTETAPSSFFPHVARVNAAGPHLIQLATSTHVWLISTTTSAGWKSMCRLAQEQPCGGVAQPSTHDGNGVVAMATTSTTTPPSEANDSDLQDAVDAVLASHRAADNSPPMPIDSGTPQISTNGLVPPPSESQEALPPDVCNVFTTFRRFTKQRDAGRQLLRLGRQVAAAAVNHDSPQKRLPQFIVDFLHRKDVVLLGFGLQTDVELLSNLMTARENALSGHCGHQHPMQWAPPCIDLSLLFATDLYSSSTKASVEQADSALVGDQSTIVPSTNMTNVGTVQAAARVFGKRFPKLKNVSVSNWATPSQKLSTKQLVYACRDAIIPLYIANHLLQMRARPKPQLPVANEKNSPWTFRNNS